MASASQKKLSSTDLFFFGILTAGLLLRLGVAPYLNGLGGDPVFSYSYRALLLAHGEWAGLFKMWHPPGFPVVLALLHTLTGRLISPYNCGIALNLICYVGLTILMDRKFGRRLDPTARLFLAGALAFWETLFFWQTVPVTEPLYTLLLYGTIAILLGNEKLSKKTFFIAGVLLGIGATLRREALPAFLGMCVWVYWDAGRSKKPRWQAIGSFAGGYALLSGWTFFDPMLMEHIKAQEFSYTVGAAKGLFANVTRAIECFYRACVDWLPQVLLLPYWFFVAAGIFFHWADKRWERVHSIFAASLLPALLAVTLTIQHKRTGLFLLPAAALYFALGADLLLRPFEARWPKCRPFALGLLALVLIVEPMRIIWYVKKHPIVTRGQVTRIQGEMAANFPMEKIWAFGNEPEIYVHANWPIDYPFDEREQYAKIYSEHRGRPDRFIKELRSRGFHYLTFTLSEPDAGKDDSHQRPYGIVTPSTEDLNAIVGNGIVFGLKKLVQEPIAEPKGVAYFFQIIR